MVVIKEMHTPPLSWRLGHIIDVMLGKDDTVRVAKVRTVQGDVIRL